MKKINVLIMLACMILASCKPEPVGNPEPDGNDVVPSTIVLEVKDITSLSAKIVFEITDDGGSEITARGIIFDTKEILEYDIANNYSFPDGESVYEWMPTHLKPNTTYYVRAYAWNKLPDVSLSEQISFTTLEFGETDGNDDVYDSDGEVNGYEYVDLGLPSGLKWAVCNVGADYPGKFGDNFAWGEINPKDEYTWENYNMMGVEPEDISGNPQYDAARANWGGEWRMPTTDEIRELMDHCTWKRAEMNGIWGMSITGPNGKILFLPSNIFVDGADSGMYWSSVPASDANDFSWGVLFYESGIEPYDAYVRIVPRYSCEGYPIRPVIE